eukprot:1150143-Pelagomonas_calceolata.AAC.2
MHYNMKALQEKSITRPVKSRLQRGARNKAGRGVLRPSSELADEDMEEAMLTELISHQSSEALSTACIICPLSSLKVPPRDG